jgi:heme/copper-type cytochrome/quinol oxidase subunit 1
MKKLENWLPVLAILLLLLITSSQAHTIDLHLHDTYFILATQTLKIWFCCYLLIITLMYKLIRWKQEFVHKWVIITHLISLVLTALLVVLPNGWLGLADAPERNLEYTNLGRINQAMVVWILLVLMVQLIFLAYFIVQLVTKRA